MGKVDWARGAFVVLMVSMLAASGADTTVTNKELGFEITFPKAWGVDGEDIEKRNEEHLKSFGRIYGTAARGKSPRIDGTEDCAEIMVRVLDLTKSATLKDFVISHSGADFKYDDKNETKLGKLSIYKTTEDALGLRMRFVHYLLIGDKYGYDVVIHSYSKDYDKYAKDIDAIVKSFKLIDTK
ncbi:MAG TPA: hypothetical protein VKX17_08610 [Planctomycetota bacterium]|nr:hypothetical protein [Planctomycetota bacterium]